ncbi:MULTISPECIES: hypothetical protein [unclassified Mesorhizobium]|uniref:hypothetical protein n=1 Tax=unclassified Mesorhizobium TaxID=325217 RepID=UPI00112A0C36|nr:MULTISPECIES: hypothetical protein [unclassified Mesorhizobium]TPK66287.1 hypothetical protein FJ551_09310 [Mesorhizobium sp. B2-5-1]TPM60665.1 hypothetical protein FJ962_16165 [Mesorhizobium sp. B2-1-9]TPM88004.1 hypothetical protein FJ963_03380 [Mesorhizobium sp. B2-1-4]TPN11076.1 hypothetical protein FJ971_13330 [Mesorhizobium sp. B2-1-2]UCI14717.1 hypothetical protein FJ972_07615 [Mesorhizobium sp. B2-1-1]
MGGRWRTNRHSGGKKQPGITRRDFLGVASTPVIIAATNGLAFAGDLPDKDSGADLLFILAPDERSVVVRRVPPSGSGSHQDWTLDAAAFGPGAWFDLHEDEYAAWDARAQALKLQDGVLRRRLTARGASWGGHAKDTSGDLLSVTFVFECVEGDPWTVGLSTNVWPSPTRAAGFHTEPENRQPLHAFIANPQVKLTELLSQPRIQTALDVMLDRHVSVDDQMAVSFNANLEWILEPVRSGDRPIAAFDGSVSAPVAVDKEAAALVIKWQAQADEAAGPGRRLSARCAALWTSPFQIAGNDDAPLVSIRPLEGDPKASNLGDLFVGQLDPQSRVVNEGGADSTSLIALFSAPGAVLDCRLRVSTETIAPICTGIPLDDVTITRMAMGNADDQWRDVIIADAGGKRLGAQAPAGAAPKGQEQTPVASSPPKPVWINTLIGRMEVAALPLDAALAVNQAQEDDDAALQARRKFDAVSAAAIGDRAGVTQRTFFLLADRPRKGDATERKKSTDAAADFNILRRLYADVALHGLDTALPDTRDSVLTVAGSQFRFIHSDGNELPGLILPEVAWNTPDGYLWLGDLRRPREFAWLDLGGSTLHARRDYDLVDIRFRFADFVLGFSLDTDEQGTVRGIARTLRPARDDARQIAVRRRFAELGEDAGKSGPDDDFADSRPILAVEFPPQHVMEEAFFRQDAEPLPDTDWPEHEADLESFLEMLRKEPSAANREAARRGIGEKKVAEEAKRSSNTNDPKLFADLRNALLAATDLPVDQRQYFGPYAMSLQAIKVARDFQSAQSEKYLTQIVARMLAKAAEVQPPDIGSWQLSTLLQAESDAEKVYPLYQLWRDAFRAYVIETRGQTTAATATGQPEPDKSFAEFINRNRKPVPSDYLPSKALEDEFTGAFIKQISGREPFDRLAMARLSGKSLLAFRVNFEAAPGDSDEVNGLPRYARDNINSPGPGVQRFGAMPFTFAALTDWSRHEPHVTQRARKLYEPLASGAIPPVMGRVASVDDHAILIQQGFEAGAKSSEAHLGQVRASLTRRPKGLETQIEIPSRLILSTAQNAIWQSPRKVSRKAPKEGEADVFDTDPVLPEADIDYEAYEQLWTARLITQDAEPGLRAIWSPDARPEAIGFLAIGDDKVPRIAGPPPRGPWSPWILRREQVDGVRLVPSKVLEASQSSKATDPNAPPAQGAQSQTGGKTDEEVCPVPAPDSLSDRNRTPSMFERICDIFRLRARYNNQADLHTFRTSLDAYDRHELVLLSSAYGLPVTGRRRQIGNSDSNAGDLIEKSGQFEPGEDFHLIDATSDLAYYRPKPLDVSELSLSALGGFLDHDTNFLPPAPAVTYDGRSLFDGLSIERWQHLIVLGRDVLATVVYSGYLFPLGHKASLVKITERIFVRMRGDQAKAQDFGVKAVLRQRMFVRVSAPSKKFPAVGQPNKGRQWCAEDVTMLTRETPDIVDPTLELETRPERASLSGRIFLDNQPGLAFWPQTAMTEEARFHFEFTLDGRRTKMPLIFVDRIAAKNKTSLNALLSYYRGLSEEDWRTCLLSGQTLRFAEPVQEGDTSFAADSIALAVDGRASDDGQRWEGQNDVVINTGVLEGADQPPFYPVMASAEIHLAQAESMSGAAMGAVRVRFDGSYVRSGFAPAPTETAPDTAAQQPGGDAAIDNAAEVFLYVDMPSPPKMSMGPNGNQSGGVGRPNMDIVALSRSKGILGAQPGQPIYQYGPAKAAGQGYVASPALASVAKYFSLPPPRQPVSGGGQVVAGQASEATTSKVFESFFSADAKLLGVISFQSLMRLLKIAGGVDVMPALNEVVDYGSQALSQLEQGAAGAIELLQGEILAPLLDLVRTARKEWSKIDRRQIGAQDNVIDEFQKVLPKFQATSLRTLYPEIDLGLNNLEAALLDAMGETNAAALVGRLAAVHEAGRQFMRELARLAANPVERIEQAARGQFDNVVGDMQAQVIRYQQKARDFVASLKATKHDLAQALIGYVAEDLPWEEIAAIVEVAEQGSTLANLAKETLDGLLAIDVDLSKELGELAKGTTDPATGLKKIVAELIGKAIDAANKVEADKLGEPYYYYYELPETTQAKAILKAAVESYKGRLDEAKASAGAWLDGASPPPEWAAWVARVRAILRLIELLRELASSNSQPRVFAILVQLGRDYLGVDLDAGKKELENAIQAQAAQIKEWIDAILSRLVAVAAGAITSNTDINPKLPAAVVASCVAQLPVKDKDQAGLAATTIASLSPKHFLADFARSAADTFKLADDLHTAQTQLSAINGSQGVRAAIDDFVKALQAYRELFCETAAIAGHAQSAHAELTKLAQGHGNPPVMTGEDIIAAAMRLRVLADEIEQGLLRMRSRIVVLVTLLADHLDVIAAAAAAGALASAFGDDLKSELKQWDLSAASALRVSLNTLFRWTRVVETVGAPSVGAILGLAAKIVRDQIPNAFDVERENLAVSLEKLDDECGRLAATVGNLSLPSPVTDETVAQLLDAKLANTTVTVRDLFENDDSLARTDKIELALQRVSTSYAALLARATGLSKILAEEALDGPVHDLLQVLSEAYVKVKALRDKIAADAPNYATAGPIILRALLIEPLARDCDPLKPGCDDRLTVETKAVGSLANVPTPTTTARKQLQAFCDSISGGRSAIENIFINVQKIWDDISRGELASLVDIGALRDQVEELISELVPVKRTLSYALGFDFDGDKLAKLTGGVFVPRPPSRFELAMTATINLLTAKAEMKAKGRIGPFDVKLIGNVFDAVTLIFDGVDFGFELGGSPRFDVHYRDFQIGEKLKFVEKLQSYMTPSKDGSGFFIEPMKGRPGILAGYGINLGTIQLGGVAFSNVLLNAAAELPFDGDAALFRFALGRPLAPFLISVPPYGGGGFVAIYADAQGFRGFEASFEFGGVADFSTGPLVAQGRLTSGFYIRSMQVVSNGSRRTLTDIYGTFFVGGEASIWIFSFYASLYVRLGMKSGGEMEGEATFTFSFSMGIVDYDFHVSVSYKREAFGGGGTNSIAGRSSGDDAADGVERSLVTRAIPQAQAKSTAPNIHANTISLSEATVADYLAYFDPELLKAEASK